MLDPNVDQPEITSLDIQAASVSQLTPQFTTADYGPSKDACGLCGAELIDSYYRVNTLMACAVCAAQAQDGAPKDSHVTFARALVWGSGAALLGLIAYAAFSLVTGYQIGYLALGVGWLVARAILKGSHGISGRRYQVAAVVLTYLAISLASVPIIISAATKKHDAVQQRQSSTSDATGNTQTDQAGKRAATSDESVSLGKAMGMLVLYGIASPFIELANPGSGIIGLFIVFLGLSIAWRTTAAKPLEVDGPFALG